MPPATLFPVSTEGPCWNRLWNSKIESIVCGEDEDIEQQITVEKQSNIRYSPKPLPLRDIVLEEGEVFEFPSLIPRNSNKVRRCPPPLVLGNAKKLWATPTREPSHPPKFRKNHRLDTSFNRFPIEPRKQGKKNRKTPESHQKTARGRKYGTKKSRREAKKAHRHNRILKALSAKETAPNWDTICQNPACPIEEPHNFGLLPARLIDYKKECSTCPGHIELDTAANPPEEIVMASIPWPNGKRVRKNITNRQLLARFYKAHGGKVLYYFGREVE